MSQKYTTIETAKYLGFADTTIRNSRHTGTLAGVKAPAYIKIGKSCRYEEQTLNEWISQFSRQTSTSQNTVESGAL